MSSKAHAEILSIDTSEALKQEGVIGFYGASDINIWLSVISLVSFLSICVAGVAIAITKGYGTKD